MIIFMLRFYLLPLIIYILFCILYLDLISTSGLIGSINQREKLLVRESATNSEFVPLKVIQTCNKQKGHPTLQSHQHISPHSVTSFWDPPKKSQPEKKRTWLRKNCSHRARKWQPSTTQSVSGTKYFSKTVHTMERCFSRETFWGKTSLHLVSC